MARRASTRRRNRRRSPPSRDRSGCRSRRRGSGPGRTAPAVGRRQRQRVAGHGAEGRERDQHHDSSGLYGESSAVEHAERRAGVPDVGEVEEPRNDRHALVQRQPCSDERLGRPDRATTTTAADPELEPRERRLPDAPSRIRRLGQRVLAALADARAVPDRGHARHVAPAALALRRPARDSTVDRRAAALAAAPSSTSETMKSIGKMGAMLLEQGEVGCRSRDQDDLACSELPICLSLAQRLDRRVDRVRGCRAAVPTRQRAPVDQPLEPTRRRETGPGAPTPRACPGRCATARRP